MQRVIATCLLVFLSILVSQSLAEIRLVCPRPQTPNSAIRSGPCGDGLNQPFENNFMELTPGPMTIKMENTKWQHGSPVRIALLDRNTPSKECVLLDNVPDNQAALFRASDPNCKVNGYPIGGCTYSTRYITVDIPNIACPQCLLQVTQIVTQGEACERYNDGGYNCSVFHSCSNVRIKQTPSPVALTIDHCINHYQRLSNEWPFYPGKIYEANLTGSPFEEGYARFIDTGSLIRYEISIFNPTAIVRGAGIYRSAGDGRTFKARWDGSSGEYMGVFSQVGSSTFRQSASTAAFGPCYRHPTTGYQCPKYPILLVKHIEENIYKNNVILYDGHGWLKGDAFASKIQTFARGVYPNGPCIQDFKEVNAYGTFLRNRAGMIGGIVTFKVTNFIFHTTGSLATRNSSVWSVNLFTATEGRMNIPKRYIQTTEFKTSRDYWRYKGVTNGGLPIRMVASQTGGLQDLTGTFSRVIKADIIKDGVLYGMAIITLVGSTEIRFQLVMSNYNGRVPRITSVTIRGPSLNMDQGGVGLDLSSYIERQDGLGPVWWLDRTVMVDDSRLVLYLLTGYAYIHLQGDSQFYTGQFEPPVSFCQNTDHLFCRASELTNNNPVLDSMPTIATASFLRSGYILNYGVWIRNLKPGESVTALYVRNSAEVTQRLGPISANQGVGSTTVKMGAIYPNENTAEALRLGQLRLVMETTERQITRTMTAPVPWIDPTWTAVEDTRTTPSTQQPTTSTTQVPSTQRPTMTTTQAPQPTTEAPPPTTPAAKSTTLERTSTTEVPKTTTPRRTTTTESPQTMSTSLFIEGRSSQPVTSQHPSTPAQTSWQSQTPPQTTTVSPAWVTQETRSSQATTKTGDTLNGAGVLAVTLSTLSLAVVTAILYQF